jgi:hypothetical protein
VTTEQLCVAAGVADRTYRRARATLLASGVLVLRSGSGGRGNTNCWEIPDPRTHPEATQPAGGRRVRPPVGARPLMVIATASSAGDKKDVETVPAQLVSATGSRSVGAVEGGQDRTVSDAKRPVLTGVSKVKGGQDRTVRGKNRPAGAGVLVGKGGAGRTVSRETPARTPAETPAPNVRAGRGPQNPRTFDPPSPPGGGSVDEILVEQTYLTDHGRERRRLVKVDLGSVRARLALAGRQDQVAWEQIRRLLLDAVGDSMFEIWLARLELMAVDCDGGLVIDALEATRGWVRRRFGRLLERCAAQAGRAVRFGEEHERLALGWRPDDCPLRAPGGEHDGATVGVAAMTPGSGRLTSMSSAWPGPVEADESGAGSVHSTGSRSGDSGGGASSCVPCCSSAWESFYTAADTQQREVW